MSMPIILVLAFVAVVIVAQTFASTMLASQERSRHVNRRLTLQNQGLSPDEVYATLVRRSSPQAMDGQEASLLERASLYCRQAGLTMTPVRLVGVIAAAAAALWLAGLAVMSATSGGVSLVPALAALVGAAMVASVACIGFVIYRHGQRLRKIEEQLPLALDIVVRAVRAGHPVISAIQLAAQEMGDPVGSEFGLVVDETTYGLEFKEALANLAHRTGSPEAHFFAVSVGIQSETGGNLAEILSNLSTVIRGRQSLRLKVKALASEGVVSAQMLSGLPVLIIGWELLTQPGFYSSKFSDPVFWPAVAGILIVYVLGIIMMMRIVNFKY